ncbi:hypothetical protein PG997_014882 [Apiospora hydei]|uniref:Heterokaryon incompatibility domain-containing protein n=1 Tax=Apiospora hydei TaxID=1337664 RepID=A0ABR1UV63_9PEZI
MKMDGREGSGGDESPPPLLKRGWVYQERLLSPRVLHFCRRELLFECRAGNQCQCGEREPEVGPKEIFAQLLTGDAALDSRQSHRGWWAMTRQYSQLRLTFEKDVLLALSGIAWRIGDTRPAEDDYLCGIWKSTLPYGLLWYVPDPNLESPAGSYPQRASDPRVPSWSWASIVGPIRWWLPSPHWNRNLVEVDHAQCTTDTGDGYGQVVGASLKLTGPILASELAWQPLVSRPPGDRKEPNNASTWHLPALSELANRPVDSEYSFHPDFALFTEQASPISVRCLWFKPDMALVLRPTDEGKFERIGLVHDWGGGELLTSQQLRQLLGTIKVV